MAKFLVRVELHGAKHGDDSYETLHDAMEEAGFAREMTINGVRRKLPTAEYRLVADMTAKQVFELAQGAADETGKRNSIIAVLYDSSFSNLDSV